MKLRITAKGEAVKHLEDTYESLKKMLEGMRYVEGEDVLEQGGICCVEKVLL
ncbi:MAG: hypothetical protein V8S95_02790 [Odoribacter sp.]